MNLSGLFFILYGMIAAGALGLIALILVVRRGSR